MTRGWECGGRKSGILRLRRRRTGFFAVETKTIERSFSKALQTDRTESTVDVSLDQARSGNCAEGSSGFWSIYANNRSPPPCITDNDTKR